MKLDESIELINNKENMNYMKEMSNQHMRSMMEEMASDRTISDCMYEVLSMEGFLPETLSEGETYEDMLSTMMEDDDIMAEMYKSCSMTEGECGSKMSSWINEKLVGGQKELDKNDDGKIDAEDFEMLRKEKGVDESYSEIDPTYTHFALSKLDNKIVTGWEYKDLDNQSIKEYAIMDLKDMGLKPSDFTVITVRGMKSKGIDPFDASNWSNTSNSELMEGNYPEGEHYRVKINQICEDLTEIYELIDDNDELPAWIQDKIAVMYHSADAIKTYIAGEKGQNQTLKTPNMGGMMGDDMLGEVKLPVKAQHVDSENKSNADKENTESIKGVEKSQETTQEKVDNLKNQKYDLTDPEKNIDDMLHGMGNNLDLKYQGDLSKETKKRITDMASGKVPKDHANVDHESTAGEDLIKASKNRKEFLKQNYTSKPAKTVVDKEEKVSNTSAVNEDIDRLKKLFDY